MQCVEDFKVMEEGEEEGMEEVIDKLFAITVAKLDIFHATVQTQHIRLVNIADSSTM